MNLDQLLEKLREQGEPEKIEWQEGSDSRGKMFMAQATYTNGSRLRMWFEEDPSK